MLLEIEIKDKIRRKKRTTTKEVIAFVLRAIEKLKTLQNVEERAEDLHLQIPAGYLDK